ncbi:MAG: flagellar hook-basal body complex protein, partial [Acidobacteria bacterium]|nr:flagellar hook-basal body complex protein [Acidobacteriota bacterium]
MLRSMYSGVSGLRGFQTAIDVVGNNIANVNTIGFKTGQIVFQDLLSQTLQGAGLPATGGGTNPTQVGLGMRLAGTTTIFSQGGLQNTGRSTDVSIQGDGFFAVRRGNEVLYTRAGAFTLDGLGKLVVPQGALVQGWLATGNTINTNGPITDLTMPVGQLVSPDQTTNATLGGNLPQDAPLTTAANLALATPVITAGSQLVTSISVYDAQGGAHTMSFEFTHVGTPPAQSNQWSVQAKATDLAGAVVKVGAAHVIDFNPATGAIDKIDGGASLTAGQTATFPITKAEMVTANIGTFTTAAASGALNAIDINFGNVAAPGALTQFAGVNGLTAVDQNGSGPGALQSFAVSTSGVVTGVFSNGKSKPIGQIALANFRNPSGLEKVEGSMYRATSNS